MQTKEQRHATKIGALLLLAWVSFVGLTSCGGAGQAPAVKPSPEDPKLHPAVLPAYATLDVLGNQKLARRLAIELNDSLNFESLEATRELALRWLQPVLLVRFLPLSGVRRGSRLAE